jgi:cysteine desulfurase
MESPSPSASDRPIYLDHAAATPLAAEVAEAMREAATAFANPSSPHAAGRAAKRTLENARERILELVGGRTSGPDRDRLVFTSGATEANRLGMLGLAGGRRPAEGQGQVWVSARDHGSIREAATALVAEGWQLVELPLSSTGQLDVRASATGWDGSPAASSVASEPEPRRILAVTTVCGQTGIREDLPAVAALARGHRELLIHADATQAAGWDEPGFAPSAATTLALAPHKFGGPRGIGGLVIRGSARLAAVVPGPQELGLRGGTEAVTLAAGFARAVELASQDRRAQADRVEALRLRLEAGLLAAAGAAGLEAVVVGEQAPRSPHVAMIALASCDRQVVALAADRAGVSLATGTACASGSSEPPVVLRAMAVEPRFLQGGIRLSLGRTTTAEEIDEAIARLAEVFAHLGRLRTA